ncbi:MAG: hypothetical protein DCC75_01775 [Proteobacteria bacterium]|nr:MAG: hypothetical protein DCC75_01775 [Pseudomonadota bacterium]
MRLLIIILSFCVVSVSSQSWAESPKPIYVVDMQRVIDQSIIGKAARNNMEDELRKSRSKLEAAKQELERLKADYGKQASVLSQDALVEKREALLKRERDFERAIQDQREVMSRKNASEIGRVVEEVRKIIGELAEDGEHPLIIEKDPRVVVYVAEEFDLTDKIVKIVDEKKTKI